MREYEGKFARVSFISHKFNLKVEASFRQFNLNDPNTYGYVQRHAQGALDCAEQYLQDIN